MNEILRWKGDIFVIVDWNDTLKIEMWNDNTLSSKGMEIEGDTSRFTFEYKTIMGMPNAKRKANLDNVFLNYKDALTTFMFKQGIGIEIIEKYNAN